jgi:hypothetical protein
MMPQLVTVRIRGGNGRSHRFWVPLLPIALVLSPLLILAAAAAGVTCLIYRINPFRALGGVWRLFTALRGSRIDVEQGRSAVLVTIS